MNIVKFRLSSYQLISNKDQRSNHKSPKTRTNKNWSFVFRLSLLSFIVFRPWSSFVVFGRLLSYVFCHLSSYVFCCLTSFVVFRLLASFFLCRLLSFVFVSFVFRFSPSSFVLCRLSLLPPTIHSKCLTQKDQNLFALLYLFQPTPPFSLSGFIGAIERSVIELYNIFSIFGSPAWAQELSSEKSLKNT